MVPSVQEKSASLLNGTLVLIQRGKKNSAPWGSRAAGGRCLDTTLMTSGSAMCFATRITTAGYGTWLRFLLWTFTSTPISLITEQGEKLISMCFLKISIGNM